MNAITEQDRHPQPWYQQFWPWFLIALPASAVTGSFISLWFAITSPNPMVVDDYARIARATEQRLERDHAAAALGVTAQVRLVPGADVVEVRLRPATMSPDTLELRLSHPLVEERDQIVKLVRVPDGWSGSLETPVGRWYLQLYAGDRSWRLSGELAGQHEVLLAPPEAP